MPGPTPRFTISDGYARYRGPTAGGGPLHRHGAFQIAIVAGGDVAMVDADGLRHQGQALVVAPLAPHRILAAADLLIYYVDPHCAFADSLRQHHGSGVTVAPELRDLCDDDLGPAGLRSSIDLDPRLTEALNILSANNFPIPTVAAMVGLSPQRLRALARSQLGLPLTRWRVWSRLRRAAEALQLGHSLADSALAAGFADQAHLTRQMREMMGLTPAVVLPILRGQPLRAT
ncbi:MAG: helix-turn-helix domain-containing protein [Mycobacterium sp.]